MVGIHSTINNLIEQAENQGVLNHENKLVIPCLFCSWSSGYKQITFCMLCALKNVCKDLESKLLEMGIE